jgi:hypothetical protein
VPVTTTCSSAIAVVPQRELHRHRLARHHRHRARRTGIAEDLHAHVACSRRHVHEQESSRLVGYLTQLGPRNRDRHTSQRLLRILCDHCSGNRAALLRVQRTRRPEGRQCEQRNGGDPAEAGDVHLLASPWLFCPTGVD